MQKNLHRHEGSIQRQERELLNGHPGKVIWLTGLSGAGKSTIANAVQAALHAGNVHSYLLDGDNVRHGLNKDLGFTDADRVENIRRIAEVSRLMLEAGLVVITAFISPFKRDRDLARDLIGAGDFFEIHVSTSLDVCEQRDPKGLYKRARQGLIPNMTGIDSAYEPPDHPDVSIDTEIMGLNVAVDTILRHRALADVVAKTATGTKLLDLSNPLDLLNN